MGRQSPSRVRIPPSPLAAATLLSRSAPVAQLDRASVYGTEGQRFESSRARSTNLAGRLDVAMRRVRASPRSNAWSSRAPRDGRNCWARRRKRSGVAARTGKSASARSPRGQGHPLHRTRKRCAGATPRTRRTSPDEPGRTGPSGATRLKGGLPSRHRSGGRCCWPPVRGSNPLGRAKPAGNGGFSFARIPSPLGRVEELPRQRFL
jgi:hypothetical protein